MRTINRYKLPERVYVKFITNFEGEFNNKQLTFIRNESPKGATHFSAIYNDITNTTVTYYYSLTLDSNYVFCFNECENTWEAVKTFGAPTIQPLW